tara:strand:- start:8100 stop:8327 length:228 start_codon:yes stop_codon:yes gene_type:complete
MELSLPTKVLSTAFPVIVLVAAVYWLVFAFSYQNNGPDADSDLRTNNEKATLSFQAVVAFTAVYYLLHKHAELML